ARTAALVVLAVAEAAIDAKRTAFLIDHDHGVHAVGTTGAAEIFDGLTGAIRPGRRHLDAMIARFPGPAACCLRHAAAPRAANSPRSPCRLGGCSLGLLRR